MLDRLNPATEDRPEFVAERWIAALDAALADRSRETVAALFAPESHWRNIFGISCSRALRRSTRAAFVSTTVP